ncbi:MAG: hypothetical protein H0U49_05025 [Parachlamydiaceae bacterium]|nr:hypothetical protein [Parachlamydiaceae bacterium]
MKRIFFLMICCLGMVWCFWHYAMPRLIERKIDQLCRFCFDGSFAAENLHWKDGKLVIACPSLISSSSLSSGGHQCLATEAVISYSISLWEREIALRLELNAPHISIGKDLPRLLQSLSWLDDAPGFFDIQPHLVITEGSFTYYSGQKWDFNLDIDFTELPTGKFEVKIGELGNQGTLFGHLFKDAKGVLGIKVDVSDVSIDQELVQLSKINGNFSLTEGNAALALEGTCHYCGKDSDLSINGKAIFEGVKIDSSDLIVDLKNSAKIHFLSNSKEKGSNSGELALTNFGKDEFSLVKSVLSDSFKPINLVEMQAGNFDVNLKGLMRNGRPELLNIENVALRDLHIDFPLWQLSAFFPNAAASASIDLTSENIANTLDLEVTMKDCKIELQSLYGPRDLSRPLNLLFAPPGSIIKPCEKIDAHFSLKQGRLQKSSLEGEFVGLNGKMELDGGSAETLVNIHLSGEHVELAKLFPDAIRQGVGRCFPGDLLNIDASVQRHPMGVTVGGRVNIIDSQTQKEYPIGLNFDLIKTTDDLWQQWPPHPHADNYWNNIAMEAMQAFMPGILNPSLLLCSEWMQQQLGWNGLIIQNGSFAAPEMPLEKFVEPFLFEYEQFKLTGLGDFEGSFDFNGATVRYHTNTLTLENDDLTFEVLAISDVDNKPISTFSGEHYFDFKRKTHYGDFSFDRATYYEKNKGLLYTDFKSNAISEGSRIFLKDIVTCCHQVWFTGAIDIDYSYPEPGYFDVDVSIESMDGKVSDLQGIFSHFEHLQKLSSLPLEGDVALEKSGGLLRFAFEQDDFRLQAKSKGTLTNCSFDSQIPGIVLDGLSLTFDYDHEEKTLELEALKGDLHLGIENQNCPFIIDGSVMNIVDVSKGISYFDFHIDGAAGQLLRLKGKSYPSSTEINAPLHYSFDKNLTHFGSFHPTVFDLSMDNDFQIELFQLKLPFNFEEMLRHVRPIIVNAEAENDGLNAILQEGNKGFCSIDLSYDSGLSQFMYNLKGRDLLLSGRQIKNGFINGKKKGSRWSIEQMQLDRLSVAADVIKNEDNWTFEFLGLSWDDSLLAGLEGVYSIDQKTFNGRINLLEAELNKLGDWPECEEVAAKFFPGGHYKASGQISLELLKQEPGWKVRTELNGSLSKFEFLGIHFNDLNNVTCHWNSHERLSFGKFATSFSAIPYGLCLGSMSFDKAEYDLVNKELVMDNVQVDTSAEYLNGFTALLKAGFPDEVSDSTADLIKNCKLQGPLHAKVDLRVSPNKHNFNMEIPDGKYWFKGSEHEITNFKLISEPEHIQIVTKYHYTQMPFWLSYSCLGPRLDHGMIYIANNPEVFKRREMSSELVGISWRDDPANGLVFDEVRGQFCGLGIDLRNAMAIDVPPNMMALSGQVSLDIPVASHLLSEEMRNGLGSWGVGKGYFLQGQWLLKKSGPEDLTSPFIFIGKLFGNAVAFDGYEFESLDCQLDWSSERMQFSNLWLQDPAGSLQIERLTMLDTNQGELWGLSLRNLTITNFRPSLLKHINQPTPRPMSHFVIPRLDLGELSGVMGIPASFKGNGVFHFTNHSKKVLHHPLFVIPKEILHRIGLDMGVMTPVTGSIFFDIHDEKVFLTKFKDVYSEGKLSKFYLPNNFNSTVDFEGNLNLQVRMKQYNLLFKLAELFTVNVDGNIEKPTYSLKKQPKNRPTGFKRRYSH